MQLPNGVSYAPRGRDSSYFDFIPTFGLNWDCFEVEFGLSLGWFLCHVIACFVALIWTFLMADFGGFTWDGVRACLRSCLGSKFGLQ